MRRDVHPNTVSAKVGRELTDCQVTQKAAAAKQSLGHCAKTECRLRSQATGRHLRWVPQYPSHSVRPTQTGKGRH